MQQHAEHLAVMDIGRRRGDRVNGPRSTIDAHMRFGEWREGIAPSRSLRTVREPLDSYGSHHLTVGSIAQCEKRLG